MGWMQKLYETYENCRDFVGVEKDGKPPLMPIYHTTQQAQVEAAVDTDGNWCVGRARILTDKNERTTLIPCTERSAYIANGRDPHPLFDKLKYLAGDYEAYRGKSEFSHYIDRLSDWCASPYAHPKVCAVLKYLKKETLMADLIRDKILYLDQTGSLPEIWEGKKEDAPPIFRVCNQDQADAFVRFRVVQADGSEDLKGRLWEDQSIWKSFICYQDSLSADRDWCYVLGKEIPKSSFSPKYIRRPGDSAKLISANDGSGFTYRGRFETPSQAFCIGRKTTEEAHSALKWLIQKQAYVNGDQVILAWGTDGGQVIDPCGSALDAMFQLEPETPPISTMEEFASRFRRALAGYGRNLKGGEDACIMGVDSATPGRLSIFYYRELPRKDLLERVESWHETCSWKLYGYPKDEQDRNPEEKQKPIPFVGAPSPREIVRAAYGKRADDKLSKSAVQRLLPCIVDGACLPRDLMLCAARRASNPAALEDDNGRTLGAACALIRKYHNDKINQKTVKDETYREVWKMSLDPEETDRSYLFGRALAYAQQLESYALSLSQEKRNTNAERMQAAFSQHPAKTWKAIYHALLPYLEKLGSRANQYRSELNGVISKIAKEDFNNAPLSELYLLGYACQMHQFDEEKQKNILSKQQAENGAEKTDD